MVQSTGHTTQQRNLSPSIVTQNNQGALLLLLQRQRELTGEGLRCWGI